MRKTTTAARAAGRGGAERAVRGAKLGASTWMLLAGMSASCALPYFGVADEQGGAGGTGALGGKVDGSAGGKKSGAGGAVGAEGGDHAFGGLDSSNGGTLTTGVGGEPGGGGEGGVLVFPPGGAGEAGSGGEGGGCRAECSGATPVCLNGVCVACTPSSKRCSGNGVQTCSARATWGAVEACPAVTPVCSDGACGAPASCADLASNCGASGTDSCCSSNLVLGGTFSRSNDRNYRATVGDFRLDTYEVTVGRFKKFVTAYSPTMIPAGAGKNPNNPSDPGWDTAWNASLPKDASALIALVQCDSSYPTWNESTGRLPINCMDWFLAEAFCVWDGGRLPTEAEWNYAAAGGDEQRKYPWGPTEPAADATLAAYGCQYPTVGGSCKDIRNIAPVGTIVAGRGKWGQVDLAGNLWEWTQDWYSTPYSATCDNCAWLAASEKRVLRGGDFIGGASYIASATRSASEPASHFSNIGARCARTP